jgi:hypothetical protein
VTVALHTLEKPRKLLLLCFVVVLNIGMLIGLFYLRTTTHLTPSQTVEHYNGSGEVDEGFDVPEHYPKTSQEMLVTTHSHILSLSVIFLILGMIFSFSDTVKGRMKTFLMVEPLASVGLTFGSLLLVRYVSSAFVWITVISGSAMYASFFIVSAILIYDLGFKKA